MFALRPSLVEEMEGADLIISHAGAGSILEAVGMGKPLVRDIYIYIYVYMCVFVCLYFIVA